MQEGPRGKNMDIPKHYSLHSENDSHFTIHDERDGSKFQVAKKSIHPAHQVKIMKLKKMADGGDVDDTGEDGVDEGVVPQSLSPNAPQPDQTPSTGIQPMANVDLTGSPSTTQPTSTTNATTTATTPQPTNASATQLAQENGVGAYPTSGELKSAVNTEIGGLKNEVSAQQKQNDVMAAQYQKNLDEQKKYNDVQADKLNTYQKQYDDMTKNVMSEKLDPNKFWHDKSTAGKISAGIGILLGGIGAGAAHGPNQALQFLQKHIENDIEAQKENLGTKKSLLGENLRAQGNLVAATNATRLQMAAMAQGQLLKVAAQTNNPIIAARAQQHAGAIMQSTIPARLNLANNEIQMHIRTDVLRKLSNQSQDGDNGVDIHDLARAGLVDHATAEKESGAIMRRQQAEAFVTDQVSKLDKEQRVWGEGNIIPNAINPNSYDRRDQLRAGIIQAIQNASPSKRLNPEMLSIEAEPFLTKTMESDQTRKAGLDGLISLIRSHADPTPMASHYGLHGALGKGTTTRKNFELGPVK